MGPGGGPGGAPGGGGRGGGGGGGGAGGGPPPGRGGGGGGPGGGAWLWGFRDSPPRVVFGRSLGAAAAAPATVREQVRASEADELRALLLHHGGNCARAARSLGVPRTTLFARARKHGLL